MSEAPPLMLFRRGSQLMPIGALDSETLMRLPAGKPLKVKVTQPRSVPQHRLYFAMLNLVCDNLDQDVTPEALHSWVKVRLGYTTTIRAKSGEVQVPVSIAFDKMDQATFRAFFDAAKELLVTQIIPGVGSDKLEREAREMLGEMA
jgi:hypothetical protein